MNKMPMFLLSAVMLMIFTGCTKEDSKELIKVASSNNTSLEINEISNKKELSSIKEILNRVKWEENLQRPNYEESYLFWVEKEGNEERLSNYEIWFKETQTIVFDKFTGRYGLVKNADISVLKDILNS